VAGGAICSEMEAATLFIVASTLRVRAGGVMLIFQNLGHQAPTEEDLRNGDVERVIDVAVAGLRRLIAADRAAGR
jgi:uridine phosphorylase